MVPQSLRSVYLAMAERLSHANAWEDTVELLTSEGVDVVAMYSRVHSALGAVRSAYLGTGCLTAQGRRYLALPAVPVIDGNYPRARRNGGRRGGG